VWKRIAADGELGDDVVGQGSVSPHGRSAGDRHPRSIVNGGRRPPDDPAFVLARVGLGAAIEANAIIPRGVAIVAGGTAALHTGRRDQVPAAGTHVRRESGPR
jgi:hypothetical protein